MKSFSYGFLCIEAQYVGTLTWRCQGSFSASIPFSSIFNMSLPSRTQAFFAASDSTNLTFKGQIYKRVSEWKKGVWKEKDMILCGAMLFLKNNVFREYRTCVMYQRRMTGRMSVLMTDFITWTTLRTSNTACKISVILAMDCLIFVAHNSIAMGAK